ncbi:MAG: hypothetical protein IPM18_13800 [Phycisphaerales bacterium]|nr:hypothetical protein [Phycisphaerales bacterium]
MTPDAFAALVSAWLDEPAREELRAQILTAAEDPALAAMLADYEQLESWLHRTAERGLPVDWDRLRSRILLALPVDSKRDAGEDDDRLDALLVGAAAVAPPVNWERLHARISGAVQRSGDRQWRRWRNWTWLTVAATATAAAAVLYLSFSPDRDPAVRVPDPWTEHGPVVVRVEFGGPALSVGPDAIARVAVLAPATGSPPERTPVFFSIEPARPARSGGSVLDLYQG